MDSWVYRHGPVLWRFNVGYVGQNVMNKIALPLLLGVLVGAGCAQHYTIKMSNGSTITTASKPKLQGSYYHFKDATGQDNVVPQGRVMLIEPTSMASEEKKQFQSKTSYPTPKKHWWQFWK